MERHTLREHIPTDNTKPSAPNRYIYVVAACVAQHKQPNPKRPYEFLNAFSTHVSIDASFLYTVPKDMKLEIVTFASRIPPNSPSRIPETLNIAVLTQTKKEQLWTTVIRGWADDKRTAALLMQDCVIKEAFKEEMGKEVGLVRSKWMWEYDDDGYMRGGHDTGKRALRYDIVKVEVGEGIIFERPKDIGDAAKGLGEEGGDMETVG
ncbi:hypothetical protein BDV96DRAFT_579860 [Lophiotrema nucula]|uniref:Uncharacterized protein n=1 Tax=Lophiotrema nucula TaxID=690887 RepID=A0A6A5YZI6_9PLEO|nr:hypothetical protein BDV96DRAFT_579860 [Lophiotrema nucula]